MNKLSTSRFANPDLANPDLVKVGIARGLPKHPLNYKLAGSIMLIAPTWNIIRLERRENYEFAYRKMLDAHGLFRIRSEIERYRLIGDTVLLCYEDLSKPDLYCHRRIFADWWKEKTGEEIEELGGVKKIEKTQQIRLF